MGYIASMHLILQEMSRGQKDFLLPGSVPQAEVARPMSLADVSVMYGLFLPQKYEIRVTEFWFHQLMDPLVEAGQAGSLQTNPAPEFHLHIFHFIYIFCDCHHSDPDMTPVPPLISTDPQQVTAAVSQNHMLTWWRICEEPVEPPMQQKPGFLHVQQLSWCR